MTNDLKQFPASDLKLEKLRKQGVVPFSLDLLSAAVLFGFFIGAAIFFNFYQVEFLQETEKVFESASFSVDLFWKMLFVSLACFLIPIASLVILVGLYQTRFLVTFNALKPSFSGSRDKLSSRSLKSILMLIKTLAWLILAYLVLRYFFSRLEVGDTINEGLLWAEHLLAVFLICIVLFALFLGIASRFFTVLSYQREHRMSRAEVEAELRETESSPEVKTARSEIQENEVDE